MGMIGLLGLVVTVLIYLGARRLYRRQRILFLSPLLVGPAIVVLLLLATGVSYQSYMDGAKWLSRLLGPATVALAVPMYKNMRLLKKYGTEIVTSVLAGSVIALLSSVLPAYWLGLSAETVGSLAPRSVTTPIAMELSATTGGTPTMAAVFVIVTALIGLVAGPLLIQFLRFRTPVARGALFGMGAHGAGTARAFELGEEEGTVSGVAMVMAAGFTVILTLLLWPMLAGLGV